VITPGPVEQAAGPLDLYFLADGAQTDTDVGQRVTSFLDGATQSLEIAIYDLRLAAGPGTSMLARTTLRPSRFLLRPRSTGSSSIS